MQQIWSKLSCELVLLQHSQCRFVWSSNDALVALAFAPRTLDRDYIYSRAGLDCASHGWSGVWCTYVLQLADFSVHKVVEGTAWSSPQPVQCVPVSHILIAPWDCLEDRPCLTASHKSGSIVPGSANLTLGWMHA